MKADVYSLYHLFITFGDLILTHYCHFTVHSFPLLFTVILQWVSEYCFEVFLFWFPHTKIYLFLKMESSSCYWHQTLWGTCKCPDVGKYNIKTIKHYFRIIELRKFNSIQISLCINLAISSLRIERDHQLLPSTDTLVFLNTLTWHPLWNLIFVLLYPSLNSILDGTLILWILIT